MKITKLKFLVSVCFVCLHEIMCTMCVYRCPRKSEGTRCPGTGVTCGCHLPGVNAETEVGPLHEDGELLTSEVCLQSHLL